MATRKTAAKAKEEEPDLLSGLDEPAGVDEDELDLLEGISEDNGEAWMPWDDDSQPTGIQGRVKYVGAVSSDYGDGDVPLIELEANDGTLWSIRGYSTALRSQIEKVDPQVGDLFAVKYLGEKAGRKSGKDYHNVKAVKRAA